MKTLRRVSKEKWQVESALKDEYKELVVDKKIFAAKHQLFAAGLAYGLLHNKRLDKKRTYSITKLFQISDDATAAVVDVVFWVLNKGGKDSEVWAEMLRMADGGVQALSDAYHAGGGDLDIPRLLDESTKLWPKRVKELQCQLSTMR